MAHNKPQQLVLALPHRQALGHEDFLVSDSNAEAVALVDRWPDWPVGAAVLVGHPGCGKSHLANVWRLRSGAEVIAADDITVTDVPKLSAGTALVVEDVGGLRDETALFHLLNLVREQRLAMLLTAQVRPGDLKVQLPDLRSRLKALPFASFAKPDDALLRAVVVKLFADRQIGVEPHVVDYILMRMERSMDAARAVVSAVDHQAMSQHRSVTRAVAAAALATLGFDRDGGDSAE